MSSSKQKKIHNDRGSSKPSSFHRHHNSRDSGVGSSSASDRASLGTTMPESSLPASTIEDQRFNLRVVQEALGAAQERIRNLEASNVSLSESLAESNKENRLLKREKSGLLKENADLLDAIDDLNKRLKKEASPRSMAAATSGSNPARRPSLRKSESPRQVPLHYEDALPPLEPSRPGSNHGARRSSSLYDRMNLPPTAPVPPPNPYPNPFAPRTTPVVTYAPAMSMGSVAYTPSTVSYTTAPVYAVSTPSGKRKEHDDGKYHLQPL